MIVGEAEMELLRHCYMPIRRARLEVRRQAMKILQIPLTYFNWNGFRDEECYSMTRFRHNEIRELMKVCGWESGKNKPY